MPKVNKNVVTEPDDKEIEISIDEVYSKAILMMNCIGCMVTSNDKAEMYQQTARQFAELADFQEARRYSEECNRLAKLVETDTITKTYNYAQNKKNNAKSAEDYKVVADEFRKISSYKNSADLAAQCDVLQVKLEKKDVVVRLSKLAITVIVIIAAIILSTTSPVKYNYANICKVIGSYSTAIQTYKKLGDYKDSTEKLMESRYLYGLAAEKSHDYVTARKEFSAVGTYKDSDNKKVEMEKLIILSSKKGGLVSVAGFDWIIVDRYDNKALLMKKTAITGVAYNDTLETTTWESSTLRQRLNSTFINNNFSEAEIKQIALVNSAGEGNLIYGTSGGNTTLDSLFILSIKEQKKYMDMGKLPKLKGNSWLRNPGNSLESAAFLSSDGSIMNYGYAVSSTNLVTYPCMWFNYK